MPAGVNPNSRANLAKGKPTRFNSQTGSAAGKKGAPASARARAAKKTLAQLARTIADSPISDTKTRQSIESIGIHDDDLTNNALVVAGVFQGAATGNIAAVEKWETMLQRADEENGTGAGKKPFKLPAELIGKAFVDINRQIKPGNTYIFAGGRGSLKSTFVSQKCLELLENDDQMHMVVVRKVQATLRDSVFEQLRWSIDQLGLSDQYKCTVSPMQIRNLTTGQRIYFRGLDDPTKLKSIKPPHGYVGILWVEEADQINGEEELRNIRQSCLRGGEGYTFISYNPPRSRSAWVNQYALAPADNKIVHRSNYTDAPKEWLGPAFLAEAEHLKAVNPRAYDHEYGGEAIGDGGNVFDNIIVREITDDEVAACEHIFQGNDWGFSPDPLAFVRLNYERDEEEIMLLDEIVALKWSNHQAAEEIKRRGYDDHYITCDSAEKKSTQDYRNDGLPAQNAIKGPDSVRYGIKWLGARTIIIDPKRTPVAYKEFTHYEHDRDKDGNPISTYPDKDNHTIDAVRYALERIWRQAYYKA